jgi:5-formyltetrahydrofolate cyclo-ligase
MAQVEQDAAATGRPADSPADPVDGSVVALAKAELRARCRAVRRALPAVDRARADAAIRVRLRDLLPELLPELKPELLRQLPADLPAGAAPAGTPAVVGLYAALPGEVDLDPLVGLAGLPAALPRTTGPGTMRFHLVDAVPPPAPPGVRPALREPAADRPVAVPAVVVVPGLAFDRAGGRLGHGGGFYDRWLAAHPGVLAVGVCRAAELVDAVPRAAHDVVVGWVVSEDRVYR